MVGFQLETPEWWQPHVVNYGSEKPSYFAAALTKTIPSGECKPRVLDLGCGSGIVGLYCLMERKAHAVTFTDLRQEWTEITRENVARKINQGAINRAQVAILEAGCFTRIPAEVLERHDLVAFNPPQLPYKHLDEPALCEIEADRVRRDFRCGGPDGLDVIREFFPWYADTEHRKPPCVILLSSFLGRRLIHRTILSFKLRAEILAQTSVPLRRPFWAAAERFSEAEREDRSLSRVEGSWTKLLLTYRIEADRPPR